jgi:Ca2+-binding RTX toxin-like protein
MPPARRTLARAIAIGSLGALFAAAPAWSATNLLQNPGAEAGSPGTTIPSWNTGGSGFDVVAYGAPSFPDTSVSAAIGGGSNFFSGGATAVAHADQSIDVSASAAAIDAGTQAIDLSGYLGGFDGQEDNMVVTVSWLDQNGASIDASPLQIGPVTSSDRGGQTTLLFRSTSGTVPSGTRTLLVTQTATRLAGSDNDGYSDNLSVSLPSGPCDAPSAITDNDGQDTNPAVGTIQGTSGNDVICGGSGNDTILDLGGNDTVYGQGGNDVFGAGTGNDTYHGGAGQDRVSYATRSERITAQIGSAGSGGATESDTIGSDVEDLNGGTGDDVLTGDGGNNVLTGGPGSGSDIIQGAEGNDRIRGGDGDDSLDGGTGDDVIEGDAGKDTLTDGTGADQLLGGDGNGDTLDPTADGSADNANCGAGSGDTARKSESIDYVSRNCEVTTFP